jgi:hypothetical protein
MVIFNGLYTVARDNNDCIETQSEMHTLRPAALSARSLLGWVQILNSISSLLSCGPVGARV